jgi:hypothetical protein
MFASTTKPTKNGFSVPLVQKESFLVYLTGSNMEGDVKVNESIAKLFYDQIMGTYSGHMAHIPNNPVLKSICEASGVVGQETFKEFLTEVAEKLPKDF